MEESSDDSEPTPLGLASPPSTADHSDPPQRRRICGGCDRPTTVCLCSFVPSEPIFTYTKILILHHPHESRHKLSTVPLISKCLSCSQTLIGRRLCLGSSPLLDSLYGSSLQNPSQSPHAIFLFPGTPTSSALPIAEIELSNMITQPLSGPVLILFDGTWKHAKEMVTASEPFLSKFAIRVSLECDESVEGGSIYDSDLILRKEPFGGCMSTMEAVARALRVLEPGGAGIELERRLIEVLRAMVRFQACNLKPVKPRPKMLKKSKRSEKSELPPLLDGRASPRFGI
ncbi:tRNA-uridine aminocarboxypropyltransferase A isoform X2 [Malania oleifera]|uniref:tRNA-uridine aminocarboxypropyltransferase A isoform X2 n=1 Tax=Malania oleifera TaxID=397392 RepID=UPI0025AEAA14|nr:tRNA-uridine aminocarboxypropyltransferase A isoform X2 [Malania oleifera]